MINEYTFKTDSEHGVILGHDFAEACGELEKMVDADAIANGGWGWVEDEDGTRHEVA